MQIKITILFILFSIIIYSQDEKLLSDDSTRIDNNSLNNLLFKLDEFEFYRDLTEQKRNFNINPDAAKLWLEASLYLSNDSPFNKQKDYTPEYLHSSLYDQYLEKSKFNVVRTALGMIQVGAVGYLAYKHIKKWGLKN